LEYYKRITNVNLMEIKAGIKESKEKKGDQMEIVKLGTFTD
jgi:hypothetical protein